MTMDMNLQGCLDAYEYRPIDFILHKGRYMTDREARTIINYGIANGMKYVSEIPDDVADEICDIGNIAYKEYEPDPILHFVAEEHVEDVVKRVLNRHIGDKSVRDRIFDDIMNALND